MAFWTRYMMVVLCVVATYVAAFVADTQSEINRASYAGSLSAKSAPRALQSQLTLQAHRSVGQAMTLAQQISADAILPDLAGKVPAKRLAAFKKLFGLVEAAKSEAGSATFWVFDESGAMIARSGQSEVEDEPENFSGHPLFASAMDGFALDGTWKRGDELFFIGAAPIALNGEAHGAVFSGRPIDRAFVEEVASSGIALSAVVGKRIVVSTLPHDIAESIAEGVESEPKLGGRLATPIQAAQLPFLPLMISPDAAGLAYASVSIQAPGADDLHWVASVNSAELLTDVPTRQQVIIVVGFATLLAVLVAGLVLRRTYVVPIRTIEEHLSDLQQGRGERELAEMRVSGPFRRPVRLINMLMQKAPTRGEAAPQASYPMPSVPAPPPQIVEPVLDNARAQQSSAAAEASFDLPSSAPIAVGNAVGEASEIRRANVGEASEIRRANVGEASEIRRANVGEASEIRRRTAADQAAMMPNPLGDDGAFGAPSAPAPGGKRSAAEIRGVSVTSGMRGASTARPTPAAVVAAPAAPKVPNANAFGLSNSPSSSAGMASPLAAAPAAAPPAPPAQAASPAMQPFGREDPLKGMDLNFAGEPAEAEPSRAPAGPRVGGTAALGSAQLNQQAAAGFGSAGLADEEADDGGFRSEATVVSAPGADLIARSARDFTSGGFPTEEEKTGDRTVVRVVPKDLIAQSAGEGEVALGGESNGLDASEHAHFKETYERFIEMRKQCGEPTADLAFDRFVAKLKKNRDGLIQKYKCRTVRFQVYQKDGKAALKATPVKEAEARR
jgi:hypothetical protein